MTVQAIMESDTTGRQDPLTGSAPSTPTPQQTVATNVAAPPQQLPKARPAKEQPWSPKAMATTDPPVKLDPKYAAERADALASCAPAIRQWTEVDPVFDVPGANLAFEQNWLSDADMGEDPAELSKQIAVQTSGIDGKTPAKAAALRAGICLYQRRIAQLGGSPLISGAVDGTLTPLSIGGSNEPPPPGKDAHIIASNGKSAKDCVVLETTGSGDSKTSAAVAGRVLVNRCSDEVEIGWCYHPGDCDTETGSGWTIQPSRSWPIKAEGEVRWAACHGANTTSFVKGTYGLRYYCKAPATKP